MRVHVPTVGYGPTIETAEITRAEELWVARLQTTKQSGFFVTEARLRRHFIPLNDPAIRDYDADAIFVSTPRFLWSGVMETKFDLQQRAGPRPETTQPKRGEAPTPHSQLSQNAPREYQEALFERIRALPGVSVGKSLVSVPGARAFHLDEALAHGPADAFQRGREFAHLHPAQDGSLHIALPRNVYDGVLAHGWGEPHPISGTMMVFGPRDADELEIVFRIVKASYDYAVGGEP
jgi:hypothetical protein